MTEKPFDKSIIIKLVLVVVLMFGFGYALVPLYDTFCRITGFGGKTEAISEIDALQRVAVDRSVEVSFTTHSQSSLPWEFKAISNSQEVKIGAMQEAEFYVKNYSNRAIVGMSTFNVTPPRAGFHFKKTECFCFTEQVLQAGEERTMVVRYMLDQDMPEDVPELTLSYTFFENQSLVQN